MSSKHTPGPWIFYADTPSTEPDWHIVTTANRLRVIANIHIQPGSAMDTANARLIAAAPESHEANQLFVHAINEMQGITSDHSDDHIYDEMPSSKLAIAYFAARAAIAKATGEA